MSATPLFDKRITQRELESYLWGAAVLLRGLIDAGDYKQFIFPLVFLKRLSDVYDEEHAAALADYGDEELADLPENHRFAIPDGAHWDDIRAVSSNVGAAILQGDAGHRVGQPRHARRRVRRRRLGQQEPAPRRDAQRPRSSTSRRKTLSVANLPRGRARQRLRVPDQEVRRRLRPHRPGVLHQPHPRPPDDAHAEARARRVASTTRPAAPAAC